MELLKIYARELGVNDITLESLIESHRYLRSINAKSVAERMLASGAGYEAGFKLGLKSSTQIDRDMTIGDLIERIEKIESEKEENK